MKILRTASRGFNFTDSYKKRMFSEPYKFDRNGNGGGIVSFILEDIPSKLTESQMRKK